MFEEVIGWILAALGLDLSARWVRSLHFFIYDSVKILLLLFSMIAVMGFLRTFISQEKVKSWIAQRFGLGNLFASFFGAVTPFCSCSSIPIFLGFMEAGVPLGSALSFLITSPLVNEYLVVLMFGFFGWKITLAYVLTGIIIGTFGGIILGRLGLERFLVRDLVSERQKSERYKSWKERVMFGFHEAISIVRKLWLWVLVGVGVGALIHNYVPSGMIQSWLDLGGVFSVPLAVLLGVPLYGSCAAIVPIAVVLFQKGLPLGTALAFMMAVSALSLPEAIILRRAMNIRLILVFFAVVALGIILTGYAYNLLQGVLV